MTIKARDLKIEKCELSDIRSFVELNHYSHNVNGVKISHCFKVTHENVLVGGVIYGQMSTTAWKKFADIEYKVLELRRLVLIDSAGKNSESRVVGQTLRWVKENDTRVEVVVSYADPNHGHTGTIYKASNFTYKGLSASDKGYLDPESGKTYHSRALRTKYKGDYKPFVKRLRAKLEKGELKEIVLKGKHCFVYKFNRFRKTV